MLTLKITRFPVAEMYMCVGIEFISKLCMKFHFVWIKPNFVNGSFIDTEMGGHRGQRVLRFPSIAFLQIPLCNVIEKWSYYIV